MPNTAAPAHDYAGWIVLDENELIAERGMIAQTIGGYVWSWKLSTADGIKVKCASWRVTEFNGLIELILFSKGDCDLRFHATQRFEAIQLWEPSKRMSTSDNHSRPDFVPNCAVLRVLKKKDMSKSPVDEPAPNKVAFKVDDKCYYIEKEYLCSISPVFNMMFTRPCIERRTSTVCPSNATAEEIRTFLQAILPFDDEYHIPPNPTTVFSLAMLAYKYDVKILLNHCERCMKFAHEIPVMDRLLLADRSELSDLREHLSGMLNLNDWKKLVLNDNEGLDWLSDDCLGPAFKRILMTSRANDDSNIRFYSRPGGIDRRAEKLPFVDRIVEADQQQSKSAREVIARMLTLQDWMAMAEFDAEKLEMLSVELLSSAFKFILLS